MALLLNGFKLQLSAPKFSANVQKVPDPDQLAILRNQYDDEWFTFWRSGLLYGIPQVEQPMHGLGTPQTLEVSNHDHLHVLTARLNDRLPACFPQYDAFRHRPFAFLGKKDEFVEKITAGWKNLHPLVRGFEIRPKF